MKKPFFFYSKFFIVLMGIAVIGVFTKCQDDLLRENLTEQDDVVLKSAKMNNFMVISSSETLPDGMEKELAKYGEIVKTIPEIGIVVVKPTVSNFEKKVSKLSTVRSVVPDLKFNWLEPVNSFSCS